MKSSNPAIEKVPLLTVVGLWSLFGFCCANQVFFDMQARGMHHSYARMIFWGIVLGNVWTPLTLAILWVTRRFPLEKPRIARSLLVHVPVFVVAALSGIALQTALTMAIRPFDMLTLKQPFSVQFFWEVRSIFPYTVFIYATIVGVGHAFEYRQRAREREMETAKLEALLAQAQVQSLKMQLHPHFLFNTLNGVVALVRERENDAAVKMLLGLSNMLRYALESSGRLEVPLSEEVEFLKLYLGVEQMRFPDRLHYSLEIDPETSLASVPSLVLQPLVENAIRHGIAKWLRPGTLRVASRRVGDTLELSVEDDAGSLEAGWETASGIGLANTRARLKQIYGEGQVLRLENRRSGGVRALITIPFSMSASEPLLVS